jgi:hypothetical protein
VLTQATLPAELAGYVDLRPDGAVRLTAYVGGGYTPNSTHSRTETRGLAQDGKAKQVVDTTPGGRNKRLRLGRRGGHPRTKGSARTYALRSGTRPE